VRDVDQMQDGQRLMLDRNEKQIYDVLRSEVQSRVQKVSVVCRSYRTDRGHDVDDPRTRSMERIVCLKTEDVMTRYSCSPTKRMRWSLFMSVPSNMRNIFNISLRSCALITVEG